MHSIKLDAHVGPDGTLRLDIPVGLANQDVEVIVVIQPRRPAMAGAKPEDLGWPPGFFQRTAGAWQGEPLVRGEQGEFEKRDELL
jgi:hypothetical protein